VEHTKREVFSDLLTAQSKLEQAERDVETAKANLKKIGDVAIIAFEINMDTTAIYVGPTLTVQGRVYHFRKWNPNILRAEEIETEKI
jgi:hypothetical protein